MDIHNLLQKSEPVIKGRGYGKLLKVDRGFNENAYISSKGIKQFELQGHEFVSLHNLENGLYALFLTIENGNGEMLRGTDFNKLKGKESGMYFDLNYPNTYPGFPPVSFSMVRKFSQKSFPGMWNWDIVKLEYNNR